MDGVGVCGRDDDQQGRQTAEQPLPHLQGGQQSSYKFARDIRIPQLALSCRSTLKPTLATPCQVAQVDLAYACAGLIEMVMERKDTVAKQERSLAVLQRTAEAYPKVTGSLEG